MTLFMTLFRRRKVSDISALRANRLVTDNKATLLDVRAPEEWAAGHAPDAIHIPLGIPRASALTGANPIITVCRSGRRSGQAAALLHREGIEVGNLSGGMQAWSQVGLPVVRDDGSPGVIA